MYVHVDDVRLFFDVEGARLVADGPVMRERPTILCLHGGPGLDHSTLRPAFSVLSQIAQIVYLDQRGHGRSDHSSLEQWCLTRWADDVLGFCAALGIQNPIVLGTSFGGYVAMKYASRYPDHPAKLVLISTSLRGTGHPQRRERVLAAFKRRGGAEAGEIVRRAFDERTPESLAEYRRVCGPLYTHTPSDSDALKRCIPSHDIIPFFERPGGEGVVFDLSAELSTVRCPTLVIGGEDDPITPVSEQQTIVDALPRGLGTLKSFPGAGHGVVRDTPEPMFKAIIEFVMAEPLAWSQKMSEHDAGRAICR